MVAKKKATAKKAAAKKAPAKRATTKKAAVKKAAAPTKVTAIKDPMTKSALFSTIAERTELSRKDVAAVFGELENIIDGHIRKRGAGSFTLPGLAKITTVKKPARKARKGINPFTGEETTFKAKPASTAVKIRPLKKLKDFVNN
ncbi:MAG: HU family DNA-binding protein [Gammaproteobacteria bacterium]|nr:HU family DNA-binding protein [Gammaproteobacteria bacterium]